MNECSKFDLIVGHVILGSDLRLLLVRADQVPVVGTVLAVAKSVAITSIEEG